MQTPIRVLGASLAGFLFAVYLTYVEGHVLETWCILCLSSLALITLITLLAGILKVRAGSRV
ncbi:MAG TPA: vitamin K epoxide reductase family protein, partial [Candidatus Deferrimicrobiaceae bacterium]|nr:vitamin K epoxide reductase family protein [Candidatus Deferrimicrobiaceae bacterium]